MSFTTLRQPLSSLASLPLARPSLLPRNVARPLCRPPSASPMLVRHATNRSKMATAKVQSAVQAEKDRQMAELQKVSRNNNNNPSAQPDTNNLPLFESVIDSPRPFWSKWPYFRDRYITKDSDYESKRDQREQLTLGTLSELPVRGGAEIENYSKLFKRYPTYRAISLTLLGEWHIRKTLGVLKELYYDRMRINANGTMASAPRIMNSKALEETQAIIKQRTDKLEWQLISENAKPQFHWARMNLVDPRSTALAVQIAMTFDTTQALIVHRKQGKPTRKIVPVKETIVFERLLDKTKERSWWKVKGRLLPEGQRAISGRVAPLGVLLPPGH